MAQRTTLAMITPIHHLLADTPDSLPEAAALFGVDEDVEALAVEPPFVVPPAAAVAGAVD